MKWASVTEQELTGSGTLKSFPLVSKIIDLENEMEQPGWGFLTDESKLD